MGSSLSLVAPSEDKFHRHLIQKLGVDLETVNIDGRILRESQERVCLACKIGTADDSDRQKDREQQWFVEQAREAGIELDDDLDIFEDGNEGSSKRDTAKRSVIEASRRRLAQLLQQPLQKQRFGKFLQSSDRLQFKVSTPTADSEEIVPAGKRKKRRRRR